MIIDLFEPTDTERLRRVCKAWKMLSESLVGRKAVARYCSAQYKSLLAKGKLQDANAANECFRKWLCFEQSLTAGLANEVYTLCEVTKFDIRGDMLVTGNNSGRLLLRTMRPTSLTALQGSHQLSLTKLLRSFIKTKFWLCDVFATACGRVIVRLDSEEIPYLACITTPDTVDWCVEQELSGMTLGANTTYLFEYGEVIGWNYALVTIDLASGARKAYEVATAPARPFGGFGRFKLILSADERFLAVKVKTQLICIFHTSTGRLKPIEDTNPSGYSAYDDTWMSSELDSSNFVETCWEQGHVSTIYLYTHKVSTDSFHREEFASWSKGDSAPRGGVDIRRGLVFEDYFEKGVSSFVIRPLEYSQSDKILREEASQRKVLTMGKRGTGPRKPVELPGRSYVQESEEDSNFFGIHGDHLVYHHVTTGRLMVAGF